MRIALVFEFGTLNGGERSMLSVIKQAQSAPVAFVALAPPSGPLAAKLSSLGVAVVDFDVRDSEGQRRPREAVLSELHVKLQASACDLVHGNSLSMGRLTGALAHRLSVPSVAHLRDIIKLSGAAIADLNRNRRLVAVSNATTRFHVAQGLAADRVRTIHNGVDCRRFQPRPVEGWLRRELGLSSGAFLMLTVGQIGLRKAQDVLTEAAAINAARLPDVHYLLVGQRCSAKQESGEFEQRLIETIHATGQGATMHVLGYREDVPRLMNEVDLLVHPAHQEPLGRVLLEAAASGLPIVATDVGGTSEIVSHNVSAALVPPADPLALAEAIYQLATGPELRSRLAFNARRRMLEQFSIETATRQLLGLWREVLEQ